jgi:DNA-directed RNA polymerase subunit RPC12/RpoP
MSEKFKVNVTDIKSVRITCKHCKAALILPLDAIGTPYRCVNCSKDFPAKEVKELMRQLQCLQRQLDDSDVNVSILLHLESD